MSVVTSRVEIELGSTYKWQHTFKKDGVLYPLTTAVITWKFRKWPLVASDTIYEKAMSKDDATNGIGSYTNTTADFTEGQWGAWVKLVDGAIVLESEEPDWIITVINLNK